MDDTGTSAGAGSGSLGRCWSHLLDGKRPWGAVDVVPDRFGVTRYRLMVYPPGITDSDRRWVRLAHAWPVWGVLLWILVQVWLADAVAPWMAFVVASATSLGGGAIAAALAGPARTEVRVMGAMTIAGFSDPTSAAAQAKLEALATDLLDADERRAQGRISAVEHELIWWRVYNAMAPGRSPTAPIR